MSPTHKVNYTHASSDASTATKRRVRAGVSGLVILAFALGGSIAANSASAAPTTAAAVSGPVLAKTPYVPNPNPWHKGIISTTFWVGEIFDASLPDGSQVCSTYDSKWAANWSGVSKSKVPSDADGCAGSPTGGCDGIAKFSGNTITSCQTSKRLASNNYFAPGATPKENPFYLDLPYDDLNDSKAFKERCAVIPWANDPGFKGHCTDGDFSYMKNYWVRIVGPNKASCYGQVEDAGPSHDDLYHDKNYVFGKNNAKPVQKEFNNAGMDVSPALNSCMGFADLDGEDDLVSWQFVEASRVPAGPWKKVVTTSGVTN